MDEVTEIIGDIAEHGFYAKKFQAVKAVSKKNTYSSLKKTSEADLAEKRCG